MQSLLSQISSLTDQLFRCQWSPTHCVSASCGLRPLQPLSQCRANLLNQKHHLLTAIFFLCLAVRLAFATTINKSQGQSARYVDLDLQYPVFFYDWLYVTLSWGTSGDRTKAVLSDVDAASLRTTCCMVICLLCTWFHVHLVGSIVQLQTKYKATDFLHALEEFLTSCSSSNCVMQSMQIDRLDGYK